MKFQPKQHLLQNLLLSQCDEKHDHHCRHRRYRQEKGHHHPRQQGWDLRRRRQPARQGEPAPFPRQINLNGEDEALTCNHDAFNHDYRTLPWAKETETGHLSTCPKAFAY